jgi:hypothetical protein
MPITKQKVVDLLQIDEFYVISYREQTRIIDDDGSVVGERNKRTTVAPGEPKQGHPKLVRDIIDLVHTPEVIAEYQARIAANQPNLG